MCEPSVKVHWKGQPQAPVVGAKCRHLLSIYAGMVNREQMHKEMVALAGCGYRRHQRLDGRAHDYSADGWLPGVYDIAASLLEAARPDRDPPSLVEHVQESVSWLSRAIIDLDQDARDVQGRSQTASGAYSRSTFSPTSHARPLPNPPSSSVSQGCPGGVPIDLSRRPSTGPPRRNPAALRIGGDVGIGTHFTDPGADRRPAA